MCGLSPVVTPAGACFTNVSRDTAHGMATTNGFNQVCDRWRKRETSHPEEADSGTKVLDQPPVLELTGQVYRDPTAPTETASVQYTRTCISSQQQICIRPRAMKGSNTLNRVLNAHVIDEACSAIYPATIVHLFTRGSWNVVY